MKRPFSFHESFSVFPGYGSALTSMKLRSDHFNNKNILGEPVKIFQRAEIRKREETQADQPFIQNDDQAENTNDIYQGPDW